MNQPNKVESEPMSRTMRGLLILISLGAALGGMAASGYQPVRQEATVATLLVNLGSATITPAGGGEAQDYALGDTSLVNVGDAIVISEDGEALLTFFEGTESRLAAGTSVEVQEFSVEENQAEIGLYLTAGQAQSSVEAEDDTDSRFEVSTPAATITVRGTDFLVFVRPDQVTQVATLEGTVEVSAQDQSVEVPQGYGVRVVPGEAPGEVTVWGELTLAVDAPVPDATGLPVVVTNTATGHIYHYRSDDVMMMALGTYDLLLDIPGPLQITDVMFPADTQPETPLELEAAVGALVVRLMDSGDGVIGDENKLLVRLESGDWIGETTVLPGEPLLAGPGAWTVTVAPESDPEQVQTFAVTIEAGAVTTLDVSAESMEQG
ncbi:MAG: hypothetical protein EHM39_03855 [Chloroflexi bacterium]|nr:MAG: hypothetical protein EHM39_03855 [Chloroflexota bacterium]